jgi:acyl-CoA thioester hydrolase
MDTESLDLLAGFPVTITLPVLWGDQDAFRHVNNTIYLRWFESSRIAYAARVGLFDRIETDRIGPILASSHCDYRRPLTYPDTVHIGSKVVRVGRTSLTFEHRIVGQSAGAVAAEGTAVLVYHDYARGESLPVPDPIRVAIGALEGSRV